MNADKKNAKSPRYERSSRLRVLCPSVGHQNLQPSAQSVERLKISQYRDVFPRLAIVLYAVSAFAAIVHADGPLNRPDLNASKPIAACKLQSLGDAQATAPVRVVSNAYSVSTP